ncbi:MAG: MnhB domain-containing protein [Planctomycetota bacterium]|jgi:multicomponent Na+:H+ antiporter subunit B
MRTGMTIIVKNTARLITGFIAVFGVYVALTGHLSPGGGFAGGVILAAAAALVVLAFGRQFAKNMVNEPMCHVWDGAGAMGFLAVALCGYFLGMFFRNFITLGRLHHLRSAGAIPLSNLAILVKVGAGLAGAFLALSAYRLAGAIRER